jgi:hypothetical protein
MDKECQVVIDTERAPIVKQMFEKVTLERWTYAKYVLQEESITEKKELCVLLQSKLIYKDKTITLVK